MAYGYAQDNLRLPLVRKVFRQNDRYICGLCKSEYNNYGAANSCMNQCWFDVHNFYPVVQRKRSPTTWSYRCLFCCRDYNNEINAYSCARRCVELRNRAQLREQILNDLPLPPPSRPVSRLLMLTRVAVPKPAVGKASTHAHSPAAMKGSKPRVEQVADDIDVVEIVETTNFSGLHKRSFALTVSKQGSKFICEYCKSAHKNQSAAEECFAHHFNEEGYEKIASVDPNA